MYQVYLLENIPEDGVFDFSQWFFVKEQCAQRKFEELKQNVLANTEYADDSIYGDVGCEITESENSFELSAIDEPINFSIFLHQVKVVDE